jgi:hypothetical protein
VAIFLRIPAVTRAAVWWGAPAGGPGMAGFQQLAAIVAPLA